jgi:hypothetical protein
VLTSRHQFRNIGKESSRLHDLEAGLIHREAEILASYRDPRAERAEWDEVHLPRLREIGVARLDERSGIPARTLRDILAARAYPRTRHCVKLIAAARDGVS